MTNEIEAGWNRFDLDAYTPYYADDATYITRGGLYLEGRRAIADAHRVATRCAKIFVSPRRRPRCNDLRVHVMQRAV